MHIPLTTAVEPPRNAAGLTLFAEIRMVSERKTPESKRVFIL